MVTPGLTVDCGPEAEPSIHRARGHDPLDALAGYGADTIEAFVVMEDRQVVRLGGRGDEQVWNLATPLMLRGKEPLHLARSTHVRSRGLDKFERVESVNRSVPLLRASRRVADLEISDPSPSE